MIALRWMLLLGIFSVVLGCGGKEKQKIVINGPHIIEVDFAEAKDPSKWSTRRWNTDRIVIYGDRVVWDVDNNSTYTVKAGEAGGLWRIEVDEKEVQGMDRPASQPPRCPGPS